MEFDEIIEQMEDVIESAWKLPMGRGRSVIDVSEIENLIKKMRISLPQEIRESKNIIANKEQILQKAKENCDEIYRITKQRVKLMVEEHEIVKLAKQREDEIIKDLKEKSESIINNTKKILGKILSELENNTSLLSEKIKNSKKALEILKI